MVRGRIITAGMMFAIFAAMVAIAFTYPAEARFMPLVIGIPGLVLAGVQCAIELRGEGGIVLSRTEARAGLAMFGWFVAFIVAILLFGFVYAGPVMVAAYLHFSWHERWFVSLGAALFTWAALFGLFKRFLNLPLYDGFAAEWLL